MRTCVNGRYIPDVMGIKERKTQKRGAKGSLMLVFAIAPTGPF